MPSRRTVQVYVDGFALYKALLQRTYPEYRWLDLEALSRRLFPHRDVVGVKFFTAPLKPLTNNPGIGQRQQTYWRALRTTGVEIVEGKFIFNKQYLPKHPEELDPAGRVVTMRVKRPEEKGTDVALATHLLVDAFDSAADSYAIVTNDSDLVPPVSAITGRGHAVTLVSVAGAGYNKAFTAAGVSSVRQIRRGTLAASQFPDRLQDADGRWIHKPPTWR
ncbi:NYN domain-containing protein [Curtobacterium sp. PhB25]|uniref:NYN domain-containing protein n=1 Tax=Curtobacterium sp. PhB25 TaxID=2485205 RepID=UPI001066A2E2|nr:NYN domain-containing protein [Curtobacterium sp. PhB25]TDW64661.1 NYN domain-containing protein [Curtobacterium sp. PhB25]